jgi:glycosyltransferase involved in cell wall biosynthesis
VGAPQNRLYELALRLQSRGVVVTVLTAMPNYPQMVIQEAYRNKSYCKEELNGIEVHRSSIFASTSKSIIARLRNYFSFVISSARCASKLKADYDFLMCESPPLFLGYSAMYLARKKNAKLIFNVSDLWPESAEKLGVVTNKHLLGLAYRLEAKLYRRSTLVTGQTQGICANIMARFPEVETYWLPNGVDLSYYDPEKIPSSNWRQQNGFSKDDVIFLYAGILGIAQGLEVILNAAAVLKHEPQIKFVIMGSGPCKPELQQLKQSLQLEHVYFLDTVTKAEMPAVLCAVNAAVIPLRKLDLFLGAIPSKIFESLAMQLPLILGVDGEARQLFIEQGKCGLYFEPENSAALADAVKKIAQDPHLATNLGKNGRSFANSNFNRNTIAEALHNKLLALASSYS